MKPPEKTGRFVGDGFAMDVFDWEIRSEQPFVAEVQVKCREVDFNNWVTVQWIDPKVGDSVTLQEINNQNRITGRRNGWLELEIAGARVARRYVCPLGLTVSSELLAGSEQMLTLECHESDERVKGIVT